MSRLKAETLSIRTTTEIKELIRLSALHERRSIVSMIEILVLEYAKTHGIGVGQPQPLNSLERSDLQ